MDVELTDSQSIKLSKSQYKTHWLSNVVVKLYIAIIVRGVQNPDLETYIKFHARGQKWNRAHPSYSRLQRVDTTLHEGFLVRLRLAS